MILKRRNIETITVAAAGRKGGLSCLQKRGHTFYCQIGRKGQVAMRQKYPNMASVWGKLGGRPQKLPLNDVGERSK